MKKHFFTLGLMFVAALTLTTNCTKQEVLPEENFEIGSKTKVPFALSASASATRTSTEDGVDISWVESDSINVFHALTGSSDYGTNDKFDIASEDLATNTFRGTLTEALDEGESYDWYVLYPYQKNITTPANTSSGYMAIGARNKTTLQSQNGNNSKAHLAGQYFPLYGKATAVPAATQPSISLYQALSVVKVHVTNESPLTVSEVSFTATEDIVGTYYINFAGSTPSFTKSGDDYVSNTASLSVKNSSAFAQTESADFYIAIKPFTAAAAAELTVSVNGYEKTVTIGGSAVEFAPGKIKTVNFSYDYVSTIIEPTEKTGWYRVEDASWLAAGDRVIIVNEDGDHAISTTQNSNNRAAVEVSAAADGDYKTIASPENTVQMFILEEGTASGSFAFWCDNGAAANNYIYAASSSANYLRSRSMLDDNASFVASLTDGVGTLTAQGSFTRNVMQYNPNNGNPIFTCYGSASQTNISIYKYYGVYTGETTCAEPVIAQEGSSVSISTTTPGAEIYYTTDGTDPTEESTLYAGAFVIDATTTVKAIASRAHYNNSTVATEECVPTCATPVINSLGTSFTISCATEGATIYYEISTVDMASVATPTTASSVYTSAVDYSATTYVKAYAVKSGCNDSEVVSETCTYSTSAIEKTVVIEDYASANSWSNSVQYTSLTIDSNVTATVSGGGNSGKYYQSGYNWRLYQNESATITIDAGANTINQVSITYTVSNTGTLKDASSNTVASESVIDVNNSSVTFSVGNTGSATNGQVRITQIYVKYTPN